MAQDAVLEEAANSKLRRPQDYSKSFNCINVDMEDSVILGRAVNQKSP